nr:calcium-binding protein [uncultured Enterobacter sp.]
MKIIVNIAGPSHPLANNTTSTAGHLWLSYEDPITGEMVDAGYNNKNGVVDTDSKLYLDGFTTVDFDVPESQIANVIDYLKNDTNNDGSVIPNSSSAAKEGFNPGDYNLFNNSCVDFTWKLLEKAGINKYGYEGNTSPIDNVLTLRLLQLYPDSDPARYPFPAGSDGVNPFGAYPFNMGLPNPAGPDLGPPEDAASPVIIDLDGDGIETLSLAENIFFDHDGNQFAENTGWVAADDGLLVLDKNANGLIETGNELFGNNSQLSDGTLAGNGYQALRDHDSNQDGVLNREDKIWQRMQVWQDKNGNAQVDEGELLSMEDAGIAAIDTRYTTSKFIDDQGNAHKQNGTITKTDGSHAASADVWFASDTGYTRYTGESAVNEDIRALPFVRGFGNLTDIHIAMSQNTGLRTLIEAFVADPAAAVNNGLVQQIIFTWAGVTSIDATSRGDYIDARQLAALETAAGDQFKSNVNGSVDPMPNAASLLIDEYNRFARYVGATLLSQTLYNDAFCKIHLELTADNSALTLNFDEFESYLNTLKTTYPRQFLQLSNVFYASMEYRPSFSDVRARLGIPPLQTIIGSEGDDVLAGGQAGDLIWASSGNDTLQGNNGDDMLYGGAGNDTLKGGSGSDTYVFNIGDGQDVVSETTSNSGDIDTLRFGEGITADNLILSRQTTSGMWATDSLVISIRDTADSITLTDYFREGKYLIENITFADGSVLDIDTIKARLLTPTDDDQSLRAYGEGSEILAGGGSDTLYGGKGNDRLFGEAGDDTLSADSGDDALFGGAGNDTLTGGNGADQLVGGAGNDTLKGGNGSDTYVFNIGDGQDVVSETTSNSGDIDTLRFGEGITADNLILSRQTTSGMWATDSLVISIRDTADSITLTDYFREGKYLIENITFADGSVLDIDTIKARLLTPTDDDQSLRAYGEGSEILAGGGSDTLYGGKGNDRLFGEAGDDTLSADSGDDALFGGAGNDTLTGGNGADQLVGGAGNDTLKGGNGSDTYVFNIGDGQDVVSETTSNSGDIDTLRFGEGITADNLILSRQTTSGMWATDSLVISVRDSSDSITLTDYFRAGQYQIEQIVFADGACWLPQDIQSYFNDAIPMPVFTSPDTLPSDALLRQEICHFMGAFGDDDMGIADTAIPLATASAKGWTASNGY